MQSGYKLDIIEAQSWCLYDCNNREIIRAHNCDKRRQIASITKIFTLMTALNLEKKYKLNTNTLVKITQSFQIGTTSGLQENTWITFQDLYYGMMLPSGNDASLIIAQYFGYIHYISSKSNKLTWHRCKLKEYIETKLQLSGNLSLKKLHIACFINSMNQMIKNQLNLKDTKFDNPHGLSNKYNHSTAFDIALASAQFLMNQKFRKIVKTRQYKGRILDTSQNEKFIEWKNTNDLLIEGFEGVKTGITQSAGGCFVGFLNKYIDKKQVGYITVVLKSKDEKSRFADTKKIINNHMKYLTIMNTKLSG